MTILFDSLDEEQMIDHQLTNAQTVTKETKVS